MTEAPWVTLIFDPFELYKGAGIRISDFQSEMQAFQEIDDLLRRNVQLETVVPKTYIISAASVEHFGSYRGLNRVKIESITPRTCVCEVLGTELSELPEWLTDDDIVKWHLLDSIPPDVMADGNWPASIAFWLIPGITGVATLDKWFYLVGNSEDRFRENYRGDPVSTWIQERFSERAAIEISSRETVSYLTSELARSVSPVVFANEWLRRKACLPLTRPSDENPLQLVDLDHESPRVRAVAERLPLTFPLPSRLHQEVSQLFCKAIQHRRINELHRLSETIQLLNAVWDGIPEQIESWLDILPRGLDKNATDHLSSLPGFQASDLLQQVVEWYQPPETVPAWSGLNDDAEGWVAAYSTYIRSCFLRRDLNEARDPAIGFGRWLKDHHAVSFDHRSYRYSRVAESVQKALRLGRTIVLVMIDALPTHLVSDMIRHVAKELQEEPTRNSFVFAPVPTITDVCKVAILTGKHPRDCRGNLLSQLQQAYGLEPKHVQLAANWQDAGGTPIEPDTRLIVYRDNRIDDHVHNLASYREMLEGSKGVFLGIAKLLSRWSKDIRYIHQESPLILVTADHGFTYGPAPGQETTGNRALDGTHRCVVVQGVPDEADIADESVTLIDKDTFHLRSTYLAARGRYFGKGTPAGWRMSHGGLLPEEVLVPFVEWFGEEESTLWPTVSFPEGFMCEENRLVLKIDIRNPHGLTTPEGSMILIIPSECFRKTMPLPSLAAGVSTILKIEFTTTSPPEGSELPVEVIMKSRKKTSREPVERPQRFLVQRTRLLVEKTIEQADFENMF